MNNKTTQRFSWKAVGVTMLMLLVIVLTAAMAMPAFAEEATAPTDLGSHTFGATPTLDLDSLGLPATATYSMTLNGEVIGTNVSLTEAKTYINAAMPVGNYILTATNGSDSYVCAYKVLGAEMPQAELSAFNNSIKGLPFNFKYDGSMKLFANSISESDSTDVQNKLTALQNKITANQKALRLGTPWDAGEYNDYYDNVVLTFNLDSMESLAYVSATELASSNKGPVEAGKHTVYYTLTSKNYKPLVSTDLSGAEYDNARRPYMFTVRIFKEVAIPEDVSVVYTGSIYNKSVLAESDLYNVESWAGYTDVGTQKITLVLSNPEMYCWEGKAIGEYRCTINFEITPADNSWEAAPSVVRWKEDGFDATENVFAGATKFGKDNIQYVITDISGEEVFYDASQNIDRRAEMKAGEYLLVGSVAATANYKATSLEVGIVVLEKAGMPWWGSVLIAVGALIVAAIIILILWKKGVFRVLTKKLSVSIRTNATIDATIATIRANKMKEEAEKSIAAAKAKESAEARAQARRAERALDPDDQAALLAAKARQKAERAQRQQEEAGRMQSRAAVIKDSDDTDSDE